MRFARGLLLTTILGLSAAGAPAFAIGPSYNCAAPGLAPGARLICSSPELSRVDLTYAQAYYVMRQIVGQVGWQDLKVATTNFENDTLRYCGVPTSGPLPAYGQPMITCLSQAYQSHRAMWLGALTGAALDEARRPIEQHLALQQRLQTAGYLPANAQTDGIYGVSTRVAIYAWQQANSRPMTGFISDADAAVLDGQGVLYQQAQDRAQREADLRRQADEQARRDAEARVRAEDSAKRAQQEQKEADAAARLAEETRAAAQLAAENSPDNHCREPKFAGNLLTAFTELMRAGDRTATAIDIEHLTTVTYEPDKVVWSCHGAFVLSNGLRQTGVLSSRLNVAGNPLVSWHADE